MKQQLQQVQIKPGTNGCIVAAGVLDDPYTGRRVVYERSRNTEVVADHVVPLAAAWDLGAATWDPQKRRNFANDPRNIIITTRDTNLEKSDKTPGQWLPPHGQCQYARAYLEVAQTYQVSLTGEDLHALTQAQATCQPGVDQ